jgi:predicted AlkP superfamily pyrophosphatase or phosphodiesterase
VDTNIYYQFIHYAMRVILLAVLLSLGLNNFAQPARHVILITIDGMRPAFYEDLTMPTPTLQHMMQEGAYAIKVRPVFPTVTLPNHTAMITGALPARHGVYFNSPFNPLSSSPSWNFYANIIKSPTLFEKLHSLGKSTATVDWPVTVGATYIDYNYPNYWGFDEKTDNIALMKKGIYPPGLWEELETNVLGKVRSDEINSDGFLRTDENTARVAAYLIMRYKPVFTAMHITETDGAQHTYGTHGYEVKAAIAAADHAVQAVLEAVQRAGIQDSTAILICGDHGFCDIHSAIFPNVWLAQAGILHPAGPHWRARFQSGVGSAFLYLEDKNDTVALAAVRKTLDTIPEKYRRLFRVLERPELDRLGVDSSAFLALALEPGITVGNAASGDVLRAAHGGTHGFMNDTPEMMTGFIAYGAGIHKGTVIPIMGTQDVAPIIARLLGIDFDCPDGILYPGLIKK